MHQHILHRLEIKGVHDVSNMVIVVTGCASRPAPHLMLDGSFMLGQPPVVTPLEGKTRGCLSILLFRTEFKGSLQCTSPQHFAGCPMTP